ncbi:hypothetical protein [Ectopseudomonas toyotomiensis]|uniref:hypothetical protein n=1 Tax=Ectopseudomonas toyotomiensis TaxID=554344 RepID=UPI003D1173EA
MSEQKADESQSIFNEVRQIIVESCGALIDMDQKDKKLKINNAASKLINLINNSPTVFEGLYSADLVLYFNSVVDLKNAIPANAAFEASQIRLRLDRACDLIANLLRIVSNKENKSAQNLLKEILLDIHSETKELKEKLSELAKQQLDYEKNYAEHLSDVEHTKITAQKEIYSLLNDFRVAAAERGQDLVVIDYRDGATQEKTQSILYRRLAIGFMIASVAILVYALLAAEQGELLSLAVIPKILASILLGVPAAYFARESAQHRRQQYLYQQYSFNLNALGPFLADFEKEHKDELKAELARKIFTATHDGGSKDDSYPINIQEVLMLLLSKMEIGTTSKRNTPPT